MSQDDYQMALLLQQHFEQEAKIDNPTQNLVYDNRKKTIHNRNDSKSLTDPSWELIDPTPDIHILFMAFNEKYFWNKLVAICVEWSKRMTTCAGVCSYQGRGGLCRITLSEPLLKLRPRKDLVETLLHEMIHAYLFVTHNNKDREGHGPEFHKHMYRINAEAGTNITVYHNFHDEVRLYKQHWWRCNGPCQTRKPYFGMVRRATNRVPGPNDFWWEEHRRACDGSFIKVKEPEKPTGKSKQNKSINSSGDIRKYIPALKDKNYNGTTKIVSIKDLNATKTKNALSNSSSTIVINKKPLTNTTTKPPNSPTKSHLVQTKLSGKSFTKKGQVLGSSQSITDYATVRNHWINKFPFQNGVIAATATNNKRSSSTSSEPTIPSNSSKRKKVNLDIKIVNDLNKVECPVCNKIFLETGINLHLDQCCQEDTSECPACNKNIKASEINEHIQTCIDETFNDSNEVIFSDNFKPVEHELIPCLVCNKYIDKSRLNSHLDDCMSDNIFNNSSSNCIMEEQDNVKNESKEKKYHCPVCFEEYPIEVMSGHLDQCLLNDSNISGGDSVLSSFFKDPF